ncbi:uncharacterized protein LOC130014997 [Mercurialis annua]|uniref:uncharacterized protein LOC130014997 n=1 Tax=Mercurialis annua TaxID=3986 RepID=UPI0024AF6BCB|nr:uncharacterized protein LOC130014997 [Mercurialis annua]
MKIGIVTRLMAPLGKLYWSQISAEQKEALLTTIQGEFEIDLSDPHAREVVYGMMARRFRNFKYQCHLHYKTFPTREEAEKHPPKDVKINDWKNLLPRSLSAYASR